MKIRKLEIADIPIFIDLRKAALKEFPCYFGETYEEFVQKSIPQHETRIQIQENEGGFMLGAFDNQVPAGMLSLRRNLYSSTTHKGYIWGMYVMPPFRNKGIAKQLLAVLLAEARKAPGLEILQLTVNAENLPAKKLYQSFGFKIYGTELKSLKIDEEYVDEDLMCLALI